MSGRAIVIPLIPQAPTEESSGWNVSVKDTAPVGGSGATMAEK